MTQKQFDKLVASLRNLDNKQLALLNFEVWNLARQRGATEMEDDE